MLLRPWQLAAILGAFLFTNFANGQEAAATDVGYALDNVMLLAVSYTHLTLPTIYSV